MDIGIYCVNTSRWLVDEDPVQAAAVRWSHDRKRFNEVEEGIAFRLNFRSGLVLQGTASWGVCSRLLHSGARREGLSVSFSGVCL
jgi:predicted dehydrogenase